VNDHKKYKTIADLLTDDGFLAWYLKTNDRYEKLWSKWIAEEPEHAALATQAINVLKVIMNPEEEKVSGHAISASFDRLLKKIINRKIKAPKIV
jgi:hypothetical protein